MNIENGRRIGGSARFTIKGAGTGADYQWKSWRITIEMPMWATCLFSPSSTGLVEQEVKVPADGRNSYSSNDSRPGRSGWTEVVSSGVVELLPARATTSSVSTVDIGQSKLPSLQSIKWWLRALPGMWPTSSSGAPEQNHKYLFVVEELLLCYRWGYTLSEWILKYQSKWYYRFSVLKDAAATGIYGSHWSQWRHIGNHQRGGGKQLINYSYNQNLVSTYHFPQKMDLQKLSAIVVYIRQKETIHNMNSILQYYNNQSKPFINIPNMETGKSKVLIVGATEDGGTIYRCNRTKLHIIQPISYYDGELFYQTDNNL